MKNLISNFAKEFNGFVKENSLAIAELEQANFYKEASKRNDLNNIVKNVISDNLYKLYRGVVFSDLDLFVEKIQSSYFSYIDKKHVLLLLIASRSDKYVETLNANLREDERKFLISYLKKTKEFVNYMLDKNNENEVKLFLYDMNMLKKYIKTDEFLTPLKLNNVFSWVKKIDEVDILKQLDRSKKALYQSRRANYHNLDIHKETIKKYKDYERQFNKIYSEITKTLNNS